MMIILNQWHDETLMMYALPILDTLQKMTNSLLGFHVDIPIDSIQD